MTISKSIDLSKNPQSQIDVDVVLSIIRDVKNQLNAQQSLVEINELIRKNTDDEDCVHEAVFDALNSKFYECHEDIWTSMELLSVELRNE